MRPTRDLSPKMYKELMWLSIKKSKKWADEPNRHFFQRKHTNGQETHERFLTSMFTGEMQTKATMRSNLT